FLDKGLDGAVEMLHVFDKLLTFGSTGAIDQFVYACLHIFQAVTSQKRCKLAAQAIVLEGEEVTCVIKCLAQELVEIVQGRAIPFGNISFGEADDAAAACDTLEFADQSGPVPGAHETDG